MACGSMDVEGGGPCRVDSAAGPHQNFSMLCRWQFEVHAFASASRQLQRKNQSTIASDTEPKTATNTPGSDTAIATSQHEGMRDPIMPLHPRIQDQC